MARKAVSVWLGCMIVLVLALGVVAQEEEEGDGTADLLAEFEEKFEALAEGDEEAHEELGKWCLKNDLEDQARDVWEKLLAINDKNRAARTGLGYKLVQGKWLDADEYHAFRGDIRIGGEWMSMKQYARYLTTKQKVSDWDEVKAGGHRVDTVHFTVFTDADERESKEIATTAERWYVACVELLNCREMPMPRKIARIPEDGVDLEDSVFLELAKDGGGVFKTSSNWRMTCWASGTVRLFMPNEDELTLTPRSAFLFKGIDKRVRLVAKTMSADDRIRLEVVQDKVRWWKERSKRFGRPFGRGETYVPIVGKVAVVFRGRGRKKDPLKGKELAQEIGYRLAPALSFRFAPGNDSWSGQMIAELFLRGVPSKTGTVNFGKVDKIAMGQAYGLVDRDGVIAFLNDKKFAGAKAGNRRTSRGSASFPMLYAMGLYAEGQKSGVRSGESMLASFFRSLAEDNPPRQAIEIASGGDFDAFEKKFTKWVRAKSGQRGRRRGRR